MVASGAGGREREGDVEFPGMIPKECQISFGVDEISKIDCDDCTTL